MRKPLIILALAILALATSRQRIFSAMQESSPEKTSHLEIVKRLDEAILFCETAKYDSARSIIQSMEEVFESRSRLLPDSIMAKWFDLQAYVLMENGDIYLSLELLQKSVKIYEQQKAATSGKHLLRLYSNIGRRYTILNELDSAEYFLRKAQVLIPSLPSSQIDSAKISMLYNNFGTVFFYRGALDSALHYYDKSRVISVMQKGEQSRDAARAMYNIGLIRETMGYFKDAHYHYLHALEVYQKVLPDDHPLLAEVYGALGYVHFRRHEWDRALYYYEKDLEITKTKRGQNHPDISSGLRNIGEVLQAKGQNDDARAHYQEAMDILQSTYRGQAHLDIALLHRMLSEISPTSEAAVAHARKAVEIERLINPETTLGLLDAHVALGKALLKSGMLKEAGQVCDTLILMCKGYFGDIKHRLWAEAYFLRSDIYKALLLWDLAFTAVDRGMAICMEADAQEGVAFDEEMLSGRTRKSKLYHDYYHATKDPGYLEQTVSQVQKALPLIRKIQKESTSEEADLILDNNFRDLYALGLDAAVKLWMIREKKSHFDQAFYFSELLKNKTLSESIRNLDNYQVANVPESTLRREYQLKKDIRYFRSLLEEDEPFISKDAVLTKLKDLYTQQERFNDNLQRFHPEYYRLKYAFEPVHRKHLQQKILQEGQALIAFQQADTLVACFNITKRGQSLSLIPIANVDALNAAQKLLRDLDSATIQSIIVIPEPALKLPPVESWKLNEKFLLNQFSVMYNSSATLYARKKPEDRILSRKILAFAPVEFSSHQLPQLSHSEEELKQIHDHLTVVPFLRENATVKRFLQELPNYSVIHLATHAEMRRDAPLRSALYFHREDSTDKGYLLAHELFGMPMRAQLLTLSACYTSDSVNVLEGAQGIAAAFAYNGCSNILMSLWEMEDKAAMKIISAFYKFLSQGHGKAEALRQAKLEYLQDADRYKQEPFYWSGIVLQGDFEPFDLGQPKWAVKWWIPALLLLLVAIWYRSKWWVKLRV
jgi:CHAT domain-containing protein